MNPLTQELHSVLQNSFGYKGFRGVQEEIINDLLNGQHILVIMPTGSGKSLLYQLPALVSEGLTVVISPLIALMKDQVDKLRELNIDATFINSSLSKEERQRRYRNVRNGKYKLLYISPERFRKPDFVDYLSNRKIDLLAIDEAHCISQWGHDFRPDYTRLREFRQIMKNPTTIALTSTATVHVQKDIIQQLGLEEHKVRIYHRGIDRPNLHLQVIHLWGDDEKLETIRDLLLANPGNAIIYFALIKDLERMGERLRKAGIEHLIYHGDLERHKRRQVQETFMAGSNQVVLATNAFGMGIDKEDIRLVIHAQVPGSLESYYQEIGRAGRDGFDSHCVLMYDENDLEIQLQFIKWNNPDAGFYDRLYHLLLSREEEVNAMGLEYIKEQLIFKTRLDFRTETALALLDRWGVTSGEIFHRDLKIEDELPPQLSDQPFLDKKRENEQMKLYQMLQYVKTEGCRSKFIHGYFGIRHEQHCGACDNDQIPGL